MDIQIYKKKYCIVIGVILLVLMGIGSIWDYQISQFFYNSSNIFGVFWLAMVKYLPCYVWLQLEHYYYV